MFKIFILFFLILPLFSAEELITPIPQHMQINTQKAKLGKALFFDTRLSKDNSISCANCHILTQGGDDNQETSVGIYGQRGTRNAPTVYNSVFNFRQFWDGRAQNLAEQTKAPVENPVEMGHNFKKLISDLKNTSYNAKFKALYKDGITEKNIANAIAEYEKTLITPNAPFDRYLRGDKNALTSEEKKGYSVFKEKGCILCHQGINIGGNMYNKFGIFEQSDSADLGRYNVTHKARDKYYFKVPSLRNIEKTAPYFHDGSVNSLKEAVLTMSEYQLGRKMTPKEIKEILAFLHSLNGELPQDIEP